MAPQIIYVVLLLISLLLAAHLHGKPKEGKNNFWVSFIALAIQVSILWWGGFFDVFFN